MADLHTEIEEQRRAAFPDAHKLKDFRAYARGRHRNTLSPKQREILQNLLGHLFADNVCLGILVTFRNRLRLARFDAGGQGAAYDRLIAYLRDLWVKTHLPAFANDVHFATLRDGNHAVSLSFGPTPSAPEGRVRLSRELWWNGKRGIFVAYDASGEAIYAVKDWQELDGDRIIDRRVIYYPDRIRRFVRVGQGWQPYLLPDQDAPGIVYWTRNRRPDGEPLGIPVVHFANRLLPNDPDDYNARAQPDPLYGTSELDGGMLGLQDEVNDIQRDLSAAARFTAFQMYWSAGFKPPKLANGEDGQIEVEPGLMINSPDPNTKFGTFTPGDVSQLIKTLDRKIKTMCDNAQVPVHQITGEWPSGEALLRAEIGLINKVITQGDGFAPSWASVAHKATVLQNTFGRGFQGGLLDESLLIQALYEDPQQLDPLLLSEIAKSRAQFVSQREVLRILQYGPEDIERILAERKEDQALERQRQELEIERQRIAVEADRNVTTSIDDDDEA